MPTRRVPNPLALPALAWLLMGPLHPYELARRLEETDQPRHVKYTRSSLYMVVGQLEKAGLVAKVETSRQGNLPERTSYAITDEGRAEFGDWIRSLLATPRDEYPHFPVALSLLSAVEPDEAAGLLRERQQALAERAAEARALAEGEHGRGDNWIFVVEERYRVAMLDAEIAFVQGLVASLSDPGYVRAWHTAMEGRR